MDESGTEFDEEIISFIALQNECITKLQLQEATANDSVLSAAMAYVTSAWPSRRNLSSKLILLYDLKNDLGMDDGILLRDERFVIPQELQGILIAKAHEGHTGIVKTRTRLRELYWWPKMNAQVENVIHSCDICEVAKKSANTFSTPLQPVPFPDRLWSKLGIDIVGLFERAEPSCRYAITLVNYFSKWPEVQFCA